MSILRFLTALIALVTILSYPKDVVAASDDCNQSQPVEVFSCNGDPGLMGDYCRGMGGWRPLCYVCASACSPPGSNPGSYTCYESMTQCTDGNMS